MASLPRQLHFGVRSRATAILFAALMASVGVGTFWGFTVDDALISARVAHNIATGHGYRFNPGGKVVDAVTPLGWAYVLAPFAHRSTIDAFQAARCLGTAFWLVSAGWLGAEMWRRNAARWPLCFCALLAPIGLWASAGMETAVVMALTTFATRKNLAGMISLGIAAAWRPEMLPFALALTLGRATSLRHISGELAISIGPSILVGFVRWLSFGSPQPLAMVAKPSDFSHGYWYALEALIWSGPIWLWLSHGWPWVPRMQPKFAELSAPRCSGRGWNHLVPGWPAIDRNESAIAAAILVHFAAVALAGGDWMPAYRLLVPVMPAMLRVACSVHSSQVNPLRWIGIGLALLTSVVLAVRIAPAATKIVEQRSGMIRHAAGQLKSASSIAAPDVGWVGAAFQGHVVDLAGATDATVARFAGGHTSKRITSRVFLANHVDCVLVLLAPRASLAHPWTDSTLARVIDYRAARIADELDCTPMQSIEIPFASQSYLVLRCPNL